MLSPTVVIIDVVPMRCPRMGVGRLGIGRTAAAGIAAGGVADHGVIGRPVQNARPSCGCGVLSKQHNRADWYDGRYFGRNSLQHLDIIGIVQGYAFRLDNRHQLTLHGVEPFTPHHRGQQAQGGVAVSKLVGAGGVGGIYLVHMLRSISKKDG